MENGKINARKGNSNTKKNSGGQDGRPIDSKSGHTEPGQTPSGQDGATEQYTTADIKVIASESLGIPELTKPDEPKKGRGRPVGSTAAKKGLEGVSQQPAGKKHDKQQTEMMVKSVLVIGFNITAAKAGSHWALTQKEADSLAEPIAAIMERFNLTEATGKYGEYIALIVALGMIMIPKLMIHFEIKKQMKGGQQNVESIRQPGNNPGAGTVNPNAGKVTNINRTVQGSDPVHPTDDVRGHLAFLQGETY
jgi:hypothetical protein